MRLALACTALALAAGPLSGQRPTFTRVYAITPAEGVFAYSRISPDGNYLAYASQAFDTTRARPRSPENLYGPSGTVTTQTVTVVDLRAQKVLYTEAGIDAYWSLDGERIIYSGRGVSIWHRSTGLITRDVVPGHLGDYYSWAMHDGKNLILTITSNFYYLDGDKGVLPAGHVATCPGIGTGDRPLISKDGTRITTFVRGNIVVRDLTDCDNILNTGIPGAKADFSYDNRYIAFHVQRPGTNLYDIDVVDLQSHTIRTITSSLPGSSLFPSWTRDGRLSFRYDAPDYRGFVFAANVLSAPASPLPRNVGSLPTERSWHDIFPETARPDRDYTVVLIWSSWSAHSPIALTDMQRARDSFAHDGFNVAVVTAIEPASLESDATLLVTRNRIDLPRIPITPRGLALTEGRNQMPSTLVFHGDQLIDRRLGAQSFDDIRNWLVAVGAKPARPY